MTIYLASRIDGVVAGPGAYVGQMEGLWAQYLERRGTAVDLSYAQLAALSGTEASEEVTMLGARGNALNYLLHLELNRRGSTIQALARRLYVDFGLTQQKFNSGDVRAAVKALAGDPLQQFFEVYLATNADLADVLNGSFPFLSP
jgi:predicted metalloprotease with PDZ domain